MRQAKIIKKGDGMFGILRHNGDKKSYTMKGIRSFVVNEVPYMSFDLSSLPDSDQREVTQYVYRGMRHYAKRKFNG